MCQNHKRSKKQMPWNTAGCGTSSWTKPPAPQPHSTCDKAVNKSPLRQHSFPQYPSNHGDLSVLLLPAAHLPCSQVVEPQGHLTSAPRPSRSFPPSRTSRQQAVAFAASSPTAKADNRRLLLAASRNQASRNGFAAPGRPATRTTHHAGPPRPVRCLLASTTANSLGA